MDGGDYSSGLENPLYGELKYFCRKIQEAYNDLKEDLTPYRDDRFYRCVSPIHIEPQRPNCHRTILTPPHGFSRVRYRVKLFARGSVDRKWGGWSIYTPASSFSVIKFLAIIFFLCSIIASIRRRFIKPCRVLMTKSKPVRLNMCHLLPIPRSLPYGCD